jgi:hypothetical protein
MVLKQPGRVQRVIISLAYLLIIGDLMGEYLFHPLLLVAVTGLTAGWMAISCDASDHG